MRKYSLRHSHHLVVPQTLKKDIAEQKKSLDVAQTISLNILECNRNDKEGCSQVTTRIDNITQQLQQLNNDLEEKERRWACFFLRIKFLRISRLKFGQILRMS